MAKAAFLEYKDDLGEVRKLEIPSAADLPGFVVLGGEGPEVISRYRGAERTLDVANHDMAFPHAYLDFDGEKLQVYNHKGSTVVDEIELMHNESFELKDGDTIKFGSSFEASVRIPTE